MQCYRRMTLQHKLISLIMGVCLAALLLAGTILLIFIRTNAYHTLVREIETDAMIIAENCNVALMFNNEEDVQRILESLQSKPFIVFGVVYDLDNQAFADYQHPDLNGPLPATFPEGLNPIRNHPWLSMRKPIIMDDEVLGSIVIGASLAPLYQATQRAILVIAIVITLALFSGGLLAVFGQRIISHPILALARLAERIRQTGDYSQRAEVHSQDEIGQLAQTVNKMLIQIEQRDTKLVDANRQLGQEVQERQKAEQNLATINQELQGFAYIVSHDLKAPLRGIKSLASWLLTDYQDQLDEEGCENLRLLDQRVDRMRNLIDGILQYSRAGREQNPAESINLDTMIAEIIETLEVPNHINIERPRPLPEVLYDPVRMLQVMQNLLSNAVKYMDKDEGFISIEFDEDPQAWTIRITDNGPGIPEEYHEKVFGVFQTLQARDSYESTGVGLAVVKKIVENAGGRIWIISEEGKGSTFCFTVLREPLTQDTPEPLQETTGVTT